MSFVEKLLLTEKTPREVYAERVWACIQSAYDLELTEIQETLTAGSIDMRMMERHAKVAVESLRAAGGKNATNALQSIYVNSINRAAAEGHMLNGAMQLSYFNRALDVWMHDAQIPRETLSEEQRKDVKNYIELQGAIKAYQSSYIGAIVGIGHFDDVSDQGIDLEHKLAHIFGGNMGWANARMQEMNKSLSDLGVKQVADPIAQELANEWVAQQDIRPYTKTMSPEVQRNAALVTLFREAALDAIKGNFMPKRGMFSSILSNDAVIGDSPINNARSAVEKLVGAKPCAVFEQKVRNAVTQIQQGMGAS